MTKMISPEKHLKELLLNDPLYKVISDTPNEERLLTEPYLENIVDKKYYSTPEVASWFEITDAQLRYYIKPFEHYIFDDSLDNPTTATTIRLNLTAILKLRMILLLKDEYRVKGLKRLLGMDEQGHIVKQATPVLPAQKDELTTQVEMLSKVMQQMIKTGLFNMQQEDENEDIKMTINKDFLSNNIQLLSTETSQQLTNIQEKTEKLTEENESLQKQLNEIKNNYLKDVAVKIRERHIEQGVLQDLRHEALELFSTEKKTGFFEKVFRSSLLEIEKEKFITHYINCHLVARLEKALEEYHKE